jgi:hypothetical protein
LDPETQRSALKCAVSVAWNKQGYDGLTVFKQAHRRPHRKGIDNSHVSFDQRPHRQDISDLLSMSFDPRPRYETHNLFA